MGSIFQTNEPDAGTLDAKTFQRFAELVYAKSGIKLGPQKEALVQARVRKRMRQLNLNSYKDYLDLAANDENGQEIIELLNAIATNVTHFYREERHFHFLATVLKQWEKEGQSRFRLWSAACSTGEEPYSMAITIRETLPASCDVKILATDLSTKVLSKAKQGEYQLKNIEKVPRNLLAKYFEKRGEECRVTDSVRHLVRFARLNLAKPPFPMKGPLDVVFCRNVMIYFDNDVRRRLLAAIYGLLKPGGYLMVGHAESLSGQLSEFRSVEPSIYIK